ncbi:MAG: recombinase family protein [Bacillota bacterium]|nr:recombinase family protein [Bacillota bacterium]
MGVTIIEVVGYARYSTDKQTVNSIEYQQAAIAKYCEEHDLNLKRFYIDEAASGTNLARQGFQALIEDAKRGRFQAVVIYDISRGSRSVGDWFFFREQMSELGIEVIAIDQELGDLMDPTDFFQESIQATVAHFEVLQTRKKSKAGSKQRAQKAKFMGGTPLLGYDVRNGYYTLNEVEARWVKTTHHMYLNGHSYKEILAAIPEAKSKRGRPLTESSIYAILANPKYDGTFTWNVEEHKRMGKWAGRVAKPEEEVVYLEDAIPAIVSKEVKKEVLEKMASRKHRSVSTAKREYLLSGLIECELCGSFYHGRTTKNSKGYETVSYVCGKKYNYRKGVKRCSKAKNIDANALETFVVAQLRHYLKTTDFNEVAKEIVQQVNNASPNLKTEKQELAKIGTQLHNGMKAVLDGMYFPELQEEMDRLRVRKSELEDIISKAESERPRVTIGDVLRIFESSTELVEENTAQVIKYHVSKIYAHADGSCTVNMGVCLTGCGGAQQVIHTTYIFKAA